MRRLARAVALSLSTVGSLLAQAKPDTVRAVQPRDSVRRAGTDTLVQRPAATLTGVTVRATRRRIPSLRDGAIDNGTSRDERPSFQLLDPLTIGNINALFAASPDFVLMPGGGFSLLGGPASSNQLAIGGVRVPSGFVTGATSATITASPWDVSTGGAAGATVNLSVQSGNRFRNTYAVIRPSASGVPFGGATAPSQLNLPVQVNLVSNGPLGRYRYSVDGFISNDAVTLRPWQTALGSTTRSVLDSLASVARAPLVRTTEVQRQYGMITRIDLPQPETQGPQKRSEFFTLALSRTTSDGGTRGGFTTATAGQTAVSDVGALQFESSRLVKGVAKLLTNVSLSSSATSVDQLSTAPLIQLTDNDLGAILNAGGSIPQPNSRQSAIEARSQATWYSANNRRRYLIQVQSRYEDMRVGPADAFSAFSVPSAQDLRTGRAVAMTQTLSAAGAHARAFIVAPAASVGFDLNKRGSMLVGLRADGWTAADVVQDRTLRRLDLLPRFSFQQRIGQRSKGRGSIGTLQGGVGRFTDWPSLQQWSPAWSSSGQIRQSCTGATVPTIDFSLQSAPCLGTPDVVSTGPLLAAATLQPVTSTRGEVSFRINQLVRGISATVGVAGSQYDRVAIVRSPYFDRPVMGRLAGEMGRAVIVDPATISSSGIVPLAPLPVGGASSPILSPDGRSTGYQYRLGIATRDIWAKTPLEVNYTWNQGSQRGTMIAPSLGSPGLVSATATGSRHTFMASLGSWVGLSQFYATLIVRSGLRYTPRADRDLNGDGVVNDAAFIPADRAAEWAASAPASARDCVRDAAGRVIAPNACSGPWSVSSMLRAQIPGPKVGLPRSMELTVLVSNPTALFGSLGGGNLSFGGAPWIDPTLVRVTGFDASTQRFRTERLESFARPVGLSRNVTDPVRIAVSVRVQLGRSQFDQRMDKAIEILATDTTSERRSRAAANVYMSVPNIPELFLTQITRIALTPEQKGALLTLKDEWAAIAPNAVAALVPRSPTDAAARRELLSARDRGLGQLRTIVLQIRGLLTPGQIGLLEPYEAALLNLRLFRYVEVSAYPL